MNLEMWTADSLPSIELIWPGDSPGPLDAMLGAQSAGCFYHCCFEVDAIEGALDAVAGLGLRVLPVARASPAVLFGGRLVQFAQVAGFGLVEFLER